MNINHDDSKKIKRYTTRNGAVRYKFNIYLGKDELNGNSNQIRKQGFKSFSDAFRAYDKYQKKVKQGLYTGMEGKKHTFKEIYEMWLETYKKDVKEKTYFNTTRFYENHILGEIGNYYIEKINVVNAQQLINKWYKENGFDVATNMLIRTKRIFEYAIDLDLIEINPFSRAKKPKKRAERKEFTDFYTVEELRRFLECAYKKRFKIYVAFRILAYTGMRVGEMLALTWNDVNFEDRTIDINKTVSTGKNNRLVVNTPKTLHSYRTIKIDPGTIEVLKKWRLEQQKLLFMKGRDVFSGDQLLFTNLDNGLMRINVINYWNVKLCEENNLRHIKIHGFRHTHASILFDNGASPKEIMIRLGHTRITTSMGVYTHLTEERKEKTANIFATAVNY